MRIRSLWGCSVVILVLVLVSGPLPVVASELPVLTGKWTGTWSGDMDHQMDMHVEKQEGATISGTITLFASDGEEFTHPVKGELKADKGNKLVLTVRPTDGKDVEFTFNIVGPDKLEGKGESLVHEGPVTLARP